MEAVKNLDVSREEPSGVEKRDAVTVGDGTGVVSLGRWPTSTGTAGISRKARSGGRPREKSEEAIVPFFLFSRLSQEGPQRSQGVS